MNIHLPLPQVLRIKVCITTPSQHGYFSFYYVCARMHSVTHMDVGAHVSRYTRGHQGTTKQELVHFHHKVPPNPTQATGLSGMCFYQRAHLTSHNKWLF